jgi:hypothetical protein
MASCWLEIEPPLRRRLVLRTHRWIVDSVFDGHPTPSQLLDDLGPAGALRTALAALVPDDEAQRWRPWIRLVLQDLRRAVLWPPSPRTEAWCRWLFLIPYSVPIGAARREAVRAVPTT